MNLTERLDLRGGRNCWREAPSEDKPEELPQSCDVVVIGAGVMGALVAQRLAADGLDVTLLDRRAPSTGATAASTALVMWDADVPLTHLARAIGAEEAARRWRRVFSAVETLDERIASLGLNCSWKSRPELYLAGDVLDAEALEHEVAARAAAGLPSALMKGAALGERFDIAPRDGLLSTGSFEVDPVALTLGMIKAARGAGAKLCFPHEVERLGLESDGVRVHCANGADIVAKHVVLATGYEAARLFLPEAFSLSSSYAIASKPGEAPAWRENALIWEASDPYLYARATSDGRIIVGGEDEEFVDAKKRDALIPEKHAALAAKAAVMLQRDDMQFDCAWAATFGGSPDGLPAIGRAQTMDRVLLAYGYGGNGVTFASLGSEMVRALIRGDDDPAQTYFDPYRTFGHQDEL
ncbi:MAG: FAD-dependent oxidoreductase [Alphaproteobacteria bacterium]|nr:MAG: FAD-dependent oxidoreductase [Alphaproteobacteria bacterium]